MRFDDFMYGGDMYGGDMFGDMSGGFGGLSSIAPEPVYYAPSFAVEPPAPAPSLSVTPPGTYAMGQVEGPFSTYDRTLSAVGLGPQADPRSMYTPEQLAYFDKQAEYTAAENALGYDVSPLRQFVTSAPLYDRREDVQGGTVAPSDNFQRPRGQQRYLTPEEVDAQMAAANAFNPDIANRFGTNIYGGPNVQTRVSYSDQPFRLYNKGKLVFEGQGRDDALKATQMAQGFTDVGGNKADWKLETKLGPTADYITVAEDAADVSGLMGALVNYGLPILMTAMLGPAALAAVAPGATVATATAAQLAAAAAASGAVGGGLSKALQGQSIGDIAKAAGIQAATAGLMAGTPFGQAITGGINKVIGSVAPGLLGSGATGALASAAPSLADEIVVTASKGALPGLLSSAASTGLSNLGQSLLPSQPATTRGPLTEQAPPSFAALPGDSPLITVPGSVPASNAFPSLAAGLSGIAPVALAEAAKSIAAGQPQSDVQPGDSEGITVTAPRPPEFTFVPPIPFNPTPDLGGLTQSVPTIEAPPVETPPDDEIVVTTTPVPPSVPTGGLDYLSPVIANLIPQPTPTTTAETAPPDEEIVVTKDKYVPTTFDPSALLTGALPPLSGSLGPDIPGTAAAEPETAFDKAKRIGGRVLQGLAVLGPLLAGTGGKQGQGLSTLGPGAAAIGTRASLDPTFSARLPAPGGLFAAQAMAPRNMGNIDYARYGYGPARSFFENVPDTPEQYRTALAAAAPRPMTPPAPGGFNPNLNILDQFGANSVRRFAPNATDEQVNAFLTSPAGIDFIAAVRESESPQGLARGGAMAVKGKGRPSRDSYAVNGPGTGRSDEIPALLSDGEYVIDAETVAMLGDGSSAAGAKRLDDLRVKIRKHKGRNLAKGRFSDNAKRPEKYLSGGRA